MSDENMTFYIDSYKNETSFELLTKLIIYNFGFIALFVYMFLNGIKILSNDYSFFNGSKF